MLLAIDTSTSQIGVALIDGGRLAVESLWNSKVHHTVELAPAIATLLERAAVRMDEVDAIAVAIGPGSFTALRVGLAMAKGLALARGIPLVGVPSLDVLAAGQPISELPLAAVLQAGRGRVAVGWYRPQAQGAQSTSEDMPDIEMHWVSQGSPQLMTVEALAKSISRPSMIAGELTDDDRTRLARKRVNVILAPTSRCVRRPAVLGELALRRLRMGQADDPASLAPIYLHAAEPVPA